MSDTSSPMSSPRVGVKRPAGGIIPPIKPLQPGDFVVQQPNPTPEPAPAPNTQPAPPPAKASPQKSRVSVPFSQQKKTRQDYDVMPDTWHEYSAWTMSRRMRSIDRRMMIAQGLVLDSHAIDDEVSEALHLAFVASSEVLRAATMEEPGFLLEDGNRLAFCVKLGGVLFGLVSVQRAISEEWGARMLISGTHFAEPEALASVTAVYEHTKSSTGTPNETVDNWHSVAIRTAAAVVAYVGAVSKKFWSVRWGGEGEIDLEATALEFRDAFECLEVLCVLFGWTLRECMITNVRAITARASEPGRE